MRNVVARAALSAACAALLLIPAAARAEGQQDVKTFDVGPRSLAAALSEFARQSGRELLFTPELVESKACSGVRGDYAPLDALKRILDEAGLTFFVTPSGAILVQTEGTAQAPAERAGNDDALDEVTVLGTRSRFRVQSSAAATKIDMPLKDTPQAMTIISDELLRAASISDTSDLGDYAPGLQESGRGDGTEVGLASRGSYVDRDRGYKINGLPVSSEIDMDYVAVERVEVVRGPASVLYGEVDYGATVNRVLKRPTRQFQAIAALELGSYDFRRAELDVGGPLGSSGRAGARLVAAYEDRDDRIDFVSMRHKVLAPAFTWRWSDAGSLAVHGYYQKSDGRYSDGFAVLPDGTLPKVPRDAFLGMDLNSIDTGNRFASVNLDQRFGVGWKLGARVAYSQIDLDDLTAFVANDFYTADDENGVPVPRLGFDGRAPLVAFPELKTTENLSADVTLSKSFAMWGREHTVALSGDYRKADYLDRGSSGFGIGVINVYEGRPYIADPAVIASLVQPQYRYDEKQVISGVSALVLIKPTERFHLLAGLRTTRSDSTTRYQGVIQESDLHDTLGRLGAVYQLSGDWSLYASWSEGIIFNAFYYDEDSRPLEPERGEQIELGLKADVFAGRASFAAALFRLERRNSVAYLATRPDPPYNDIYGNVGRQNHQGMEIEMLGEIAPGLNVLASYQYLDIDVLAAEDPAAVGKRPPSAPRNSASAFLTYAFQRAPLSRLTIGGGMVHRSKREADSVGTVSLPAFTRLDLRASYDLSDHLVAEAVARNITNQRIIGSSYGSAEFGLIHLDPRSYSVRLSYKF